MTSQFGLAAPANTQEPVIRRLNKAFAKAARDPDAVRKTVDDGIELATSSPAEFSAMIAKEFEKLDALLKPDAAARKELPARQGIGRLLPSAMAGFGQRAARCRLPGG